jgi:hypothetical protein
MNEKINILLGTILVVLGILFVILTINLYILFYKIKKDHLSFMHKHIDEFSRISPATQLAWLIVSGKCSEIPNVKIRKQCAIARFFYFVSFFCFAVAFGIFFWKR